MKKQLTALLLLLYACLSSAQIPSPYGIFGGAIPSSELPTTNVATGTVAFTSDRGALTWNGTLWVTFGSGGGSSSVPLAPLLTQTYDQAMSGSNTTFDLLFGTNVTPGSGQTQISDCTQLEGYFNWWGDSMITVSGETTTGINGQNYNSDMERFQSCNPYNFVFGTDFLTLQGINEQASTFQTSITTGTSGTLYTCTGTPCTFTIPIGTLGLAATVSFSGTGTCTGTSLVIAASPTGGLYQGNQISGTGISANTVIVNAPSGNGAGTYTTSQACTSSGATITSSNAPIVGQILDSEFRGFYEITAVTAGTSLTLTPLFGSSGTNIAFNNATVLLPYYVDTLAASLAQNATGATLTTPVPAGCVTGMMLSVVNGSNQVVSNSTSRMTMGSGGAVTFDNPWTYAGTFLSGTTIICMQPITSAQIWTNSYRLPGTNGAVWYGFDAYVSLPTDSSGGYNLLSSTCATTIISAATIAGVPQNFPWGAFPSFWQYGGNYPASSVADNSEIDFLTMLYYPPQGPWVDQPGYYNSGTPASIAAIGPTFSGGWQTGSTVGSSSAATCGAGTNVYWTLAPNNIYMGASLAGPQRLSAIWTPTQVYTYVNNQLVKVENYQWSGQGWAQVGFQLPIGNFKSSGHNLAFPMLSTNFPSYAYEITRFRVQEMP
jgi:hypothetical protein